MKTGAQSPVSSAAIALVAGIYIHFLLFAQFGFLQGARAAGHTPATIHAVLAAMALAGITTGFVAAAAIDRTDPRWVAGAGFVLAGSASVLAGLLFQGTGIPYAPLVAIALLTGAGLGAATVSAAVLLRPLTGGRALGTHVGLGTGAAYLVCNVPAVFTASPANTGWISALAALLGFLSVAAGRPRAERDDEPHYATLVSPGAITVATAGFLALVWFDSAAFTAVQNSPELRTAFWSGSGALWTIGGVHAAAAVTSGVLIDRGAFPITLACAFALLVAGHVGFGFAATAWVTPTYAAGVSLYSTALAAFAALGPAARGVRPAWRAAWLYAIAGWIGSAAGVGLAEQSGRVPAWAAPTAAALLGAAALRLVFIDHPHAPARTP